MGTAVGAGLALIIGGSVISFVTANESGRTILFGIEFLAGWQWVFILVGLPGLLIAALAALIKEPRRIIAETENGNGENPVALNEVKHFFLQHFDFHFPHHAAASFSNLALVGINSWVSVYFIRIHGWSLSEAGLNIGLSLIFGGLVGLVGGGLLSDHMSVRFKGGKAIFCLSCALVAVPFSLLFALTENASFSLISVSYTHLTLPTICSV
mgnify:FL=1